MPKWKIQSMQFRAAMGAVSSEGTSNFNPSYQVSEPVDDRIDCQWCGRKFNEVAGNRHIPVCEKKYKENLMKQGPKPKRR
jgi:hypothetical protein